jgi:hypothetical protein
VDKPKPAEFLYLYFATIKLNRHDRIRLERSVCELIIEAMHSLANNVMPEALPSPAGPQGPLAA